MGSHITRYSVMPIPPVDAHTTWFDAGAVRLGVEYRLLTDAIAAAARVEEARGDERGQTTELDDRGVSIHVCGLQDGEEREFLRFDCFVEDPHYHYISWRDRTNEMLHMDPAALGDPVEFALESIERRLPALLARAGAAEVAGDVDGHALERALRAARDEAMRLRAANAGADPHPEGAAR
jgi:hypothetical protein